MTGALQYDTLNPTGYAQVLDEVQSGAVTRTYAWGLQLVSETQLVAATPPASPWQTNWYGYDGHGSVRYLTDASGAVTDTYTYDAFGNLINSTGSTANNYLFAGEQFDPDLGLYYNRARYLDVRVGRFWGMDTDEGDDQEPLSLHKYLYARANPLNRFDPSGNDDIGDTLDAMSSLNFMTLLGSGATSGISASQVQSQGQIAQQNAGALVSAAETNLSANAHPEMIKLCFGRDNKRLRDILVGYYQAIGNGLGLQINYDQPSLIDQLLGGENEVAEVHHSENPLRITLYKAWFTLPLLPTGAVYSTAKSQAGTAVHELAHVEIPATQNIPEEAYGDAALALDPQMMTENPDNYSIFAEFSYRASRLLPH